MTYTKGGITDTFLHLFLSTILAGFDGELKEGEVWIDASDK